MRRLLRRKQDAKKRALDAFVRKWEREYDRAHPEVPKE